MKAHISELTRPWLDDPGAWAAGDDESGVPAVDLPDALFEVDMGGGWVSMTGAQILAALMGISTGEGVCRE